MTMLLILVFTINGQSSQAPMGVMLDHDACVIAGEGMAVIIEAANPGLSVEWSCEAVGQDA